MNDSRLTCVLDIGALAAGGINDIAAYADRIGVDFRYRKIGGFFVRSYSIVATGTSGQIKTFRNYLFAVTGQWI